MSLNQIADYHLEQAHLDWLGLRSQMVVGISALFILCAVNGFFLHRQIVDICLYFFAGLLTALIILEITGRFGNRLRASSPIWAAMLFYVYPGATGVNSAVSTTNGFASCLLLLTIFLLLRWNKWRSRTISLILFVLAIGLISYGHTFKLESAWMQSAIYCFFPLRHSPSKIIVYLFSFAYCVAALLLLWRLFLSTIRLKSIVSIFFPILTLLAIGLWQDWQLINTACLASLLSLICLPAIDMATKKSRMILAVTGTFLLAILASVFEYESIDQANWLKRERSQSSSSLQPARILFLFGSNCQDRVLFYPPKSVLVESNAWYKGSLFQPIVEKHDGFMRAFPGNGGSGLSIYLKDNFQFERIREIYLVMHCYDFYNQWRKISCQILWRNNKSDKQYKCNFVPLSNGSYLADLSKNSNWMEGGKIRDLALHFGPANYCFDLYYLGYR